MQATIAALAARKCCISPGDCLIVDAMLINVAIAPGPNVIGIASGTNATLALPSSARGTIPPDGGGLNRSNPTRVRITPPTTRTMLNGTSKTRSNSVPKSRKKKQSSRA